MIENIRLSFQGIWAHKLRSLLTMLGIIIGIAAIIAIVSTIKGTAEQIKENLVGSGNNVVEIKLKQGEWDYASGDYGSSGVKVITDKVKEDILAVDEVTAVASYRYGTMYNGVTYESNAINGITMIGADKDYMQMAGYTVTRGRMFVDRDYKNYKKFVILDDAAASSIAGGENPVGKTIEIKGDPYVIIGVVEQLDSFAPRITSLQDWQTYYGDSAAGRLFLPDVNWPMIYGFDEPYNVIIKPRSTDDITEAGKKSADILNEFIGAKKDTPSEDKSEDSEESNFKYKSQDLLEKAKQMQQVSQSTSQQLIWIASISLLVGGIGVMNIMLVSVTERTREIGLKKALGARKGVILGQFLTEAAVLTSLGGLIGVAGGIGLAYLISNVADVPVAISGAAIAVSVAFSTIIGVVFGLIPSVKAANLNPIDALRYE